MSNPIIILCNLGGPNSLDEVEPFLLDLLGDPNVIRLPFFLRFFQKTLAKIIVKRRLPFSQKLYSEIGGKSPLVALTQIQAKLLEKKSGLKTFITMNCGTPGIDELKQKLDNIHRPFDEAIIVPLFPQYSTTTTKTSFEKVTELFRSRFPAVKLSFVKSYPSHPKFIAAWAGRIQQRLNRFNFPVEIIFSAHGIPENYVKEGDPYLQEVQASVKAIMEYFPGQTYKLCFQSKFGRGKWLEPSTIKVIEALPAGSHALIVPISFTSDHVETLHEIGIEFHELAQKRGVKLYRTPGLNHAALFIECLNDLVQEISKKTVSR